MEDLRHVDMYSYRMLKQVLAGQYECTFEADLGNGQETELCEGGSQISLTAENRENFVRLYLDRYFAVDKPMHDAIIKGIKLVCQPLIFPLLTPSVSSLVAFSSPKINPEAFCNQLSYDRDLTKVRLATMFKKMIRSFSNIELQLLLKFITGSSRLGIGPSRRVSLYLITRSEPSEKLDKSFPVGHTCGESVDVPNYSTIEVMKR